MKEHDFFGRKKGGVNLHNKIYFIFLSGKIVALLSNNRKIKKVFKNFF